MLNKKIAIPVVAALGFASLQTASATVIATINGTNLFTTDAGTPAITGAATVNSGLAPVGDFNIRERRISGQTDRHIASFIDFDVSGITIAEANDPNFEAVFSADFVSRLNALNAAPATVGQVTDATITFDSAGLTTTGGAGSAINPVELIGNIQTEAFGIVSTDITTIVQGWVNDPATNLGLAVYIPILEAQAAGFTSPQLVASVVPEPSALALLALGFLPLVRRRR